MTQLNVLVKVLHARATMHDTSCAADFAKW